MSIKAFNDIDKYAVFIKQIENELKLIKKCHFKKIDVTKFKYNL